MSATATKKPLFAAASFFKKSPLTDSNRRPPPYHGGWSLRRRVGPSVLPALFLSAYAALRPLWAKCLSVPEEPRETRHVSPRSVSKPLPWRTRCAE